MDPQFEAEHLTLTGFRCLPGSPCVITGLDASLGFGAVSLEVNWGLRVERCGAGCRAGAGVEGSVGGMEVLSSSLPFLG